MAAAAAYAVLKHSESGQTREDCVTPFGVHPLRVIERLRRAGELDADLLSAAALHDTVEDCSVAVEELAQRFGPAVGGLVGELTRGMTQTFADYANQLESASREAKAIKLADRLDNVLEMRSFGSSTFGDIPVGEYLAQSQEVLAACRTGNSLLAAELANEIAKTPG